MQKQMLPKAKTDLMDLIDSLLEKKENSRLAANCYVEVLDHVHDVVVDDLLESRWKIHA